MSSNMAAKSCTAYASERECHSDTGGTVPGGYQAQSTPGGLLPSPLRPPVGLFEIEIAALRPCLPEFLYPDPK